MLRFVSRFMLLLLFCGIGNVNAHLTTQLQSLAFPTDQLSLEGTSTQTPITTDTTSAYTATTSEPSVPTSATYQAASETGTTTQQPSSAVGETVQTTPADHSTNAMSTSGTTVVLAGETTAEPKTTATTLATSEETVAPTNATTPVPTNATTVGPTNATTVEPTNATTPVPTNATTVGPTNATTVGPTNATTIVTTASTPVPTTLPPLPSPTVGEYAIRADPNSSVCLIAKMGLQFSFSSVEGKFQTVNLDPMPNVTTINGTCGWNGSDSVLILESDKITVQFVFARQMGKFHLSSLNFTVDTGSGSRFSAVNTNLSLWEASLGSSYMCQKEQSYNITDHLILNTFQLRVQPFNVSNNYFSTAEECFLDTDLSFVVPIAVGMALGFLIILVLISYLIGRRKSHTGYQSV